MPDNIRDDEQLAAVEAMQPFPPPPQMLNVPAQAMEAGVAQAFGVWPGPGNVPERDFRRLWPHKPVYLEWAGGPIFPGCFRNGAVWLDDCWTKAVDGALIKGLNGRNHIYDAALPRLRRDRPAPELVEPLPDYELREDEEMTRKLPPFKLPYGTLEEASLRLRNTVIMVKNDPVWIYEVGGRDHKSIELYVENVNGARSKLPLAKVPDLRSPAPGYIEYNGSVCYLSRVPERVFQQGLNNKNGQLREVGRGRTFEVGVRAVLDGLGKRKPVRWAEKHKAQLDSELAVVRCIRLSDHVAAYRSRRGQISVEYRGRYLGVLNGRVVTAGDPGDLLPTWITNDLGEVGLEMRAP